MFAAKIGVLGVLGFVLPLGATILWCLLLRPELSSFVAPVFGPWAGVLYGHHECTLATLAPAIPISLVILGAASLAGIKLLRGRQGRAVALAVAALWAVVWELTALLSVANTSI